MVVKICSCNLLFSNIIYLGKTEPHPTQTTRPIQVAKGSHGKQRDLCITRIFNPGFFFFSSLFKKVVDAEWCPSNQQLSLNHAPCMYELKA